VAPTLTTKPARAQLHLREPAKDKDGFKPGGSLEVINFHFNPKDYTTALNANWSFEPKKYDRDQAEFTGTALRTLDLEMFLDATDEPDGDVSKAIDSLLSTVKPTAKSVSSNTPYPPIVVFSWGTAAPFLGVVKSVSCSLTLFRDSGRPVRATCKLAMQELRRTPAKQNPSSGTLSSVRTHTVVLGDSLASIANAEYAEPAMWRAIAIANKLDDPLRLRVGHELLLPNVADAAATC
jgi:nucleoid-associated protein YgaU